MKKKVSAISGILAGCAMMAIILDGKTVLHSMQDGIQLCMQAVIPSLFPFFVLSGIISSSLLGENFLPFRHLGKLCKVPKGAESLLAVGLLSGYPVGAQQITQAFNSGSLPLDVARRMLGFCSNAGPAFFFGILAHQFEDPLIPWILWCIHMASALFCGWILPGDIPNDCVIQKGKPTPLPTALENALGNMATVCGWVVVFRVILGLANKWFLWLFPNELQVLFTGVLELSNGCIMLNKLPQEGLRFIFASFMLSFGGVCVMMQTHSVTAGLGVGCYFPGKVLQALIATTLSFALQPILFSEEHVFYVPLTLYGSLILLTAFSIYIIKSKKVVAFGRRMLYNIDT